MKLIITFSGREGGNCDSIAQHIAAPEDRILPFRNVPHHACSGCAYECMQGRCRYREDGVYGLYAAMAEAAHVILIVPMYSGHPASLYFTFNERGQDYFMNHPETYERIVSKLSIIGIYGSAQETPDFMPMLAKWYDCTGTGPHMLGLERHAYHQKTADLLLDNDEARARIDQFAAGIEA